MAKKKPHPNGKRPSRRPPSAPAEPPDRRVMEGVIHQFTAQLQGRPGGETPAGRAQALVYSAFSERDGQRRLALAHEALALDPNCADAYVLLAEHTQGRKERLELYEKGVEAGERTLGPEVFERTVGHFWGVVETRPYMRARFGLAVALWDDVRRDAAVRHLQEMLRLNPGDNQGVRYTLAAYLLFLDQDETLAKLLERFDEDSAAWTYSRALVAFRREGNTIGSRRLLKAARKSNPFVPDYLLGNKMPPPEKPSLYSPGTESEALFYVVQNMIGWKSTAGAAGWLRANLGTKKKVQAPQGKGPLDFIKRGLTTHLKQKADVWQADFRRVPNWMRIAGEFTRPWVILVTNCGEGTILAHELPLEVPTPALLWDTVTKAMQHPAAGTPHRPTELQVPPSERWESLRPHFEEVGIRLVTTAELTDLDNVFADVHEQICGRPEPGLLDVEGVTPHKAGEFYDAAAYFFQQAPWKAIGYEGAVRVECDKFPGGPWFAVIMGQGGMTMGLALYRDLAFLRNIELDAGDEENARRSVSTALIFGEEWNVPVADLDAVKRHGWPLAREDAYPHVLHTEAEMTMRPPLDWELELMEVCLRALPDFVKRRRQDDTIRDEITVQTASGAVQLGLSWVPEVGGG